MTFDPTRFPQLPQVSGAELDIRLEWNEPAWGGATEALAAGPLLLKGGEMVLDPAREAFNTGGSIWRTTHQSAVGLLGGG
ncbi:hypothetical protein ACFP81_06705 [Deinococcus lacus]|uniref:Uncharacterized protein n=1 Tax=Deinococcus lacus TaxID=392561 RepID=A0ABW1YBW1_9DEIO